MTVADKRGCIFQIKPPGKAVIDSSGSHVEVRVCADCRYIILCQKVWRRAWAQVPERMKNHRMVAYHKLRFFPRCLVHHIRCNIQRKDGRADFRFLISGKQAGIIKIHLA